MRPKSNSILFSSLLITGLGLSGCASWGDTYCSSPVKIRGTQFVCHKPINKEEQKPIQTLSNEEIAKTKCYSNARGQILCYKTDDNRRITGE